MSRRFLPAIWAFTLLFLLMQAPAMAASYVVAPFSVSGSQGYSYLGQAVPSMLTSRLFLQGSFEPVARQDAALKEKAPASKDAAASIAKKYTADYIVYTVFVNVISHLRLRFFALLFRQKLSPPHRKRS